MEEPGLNLVEILKDCPKDFRLYSTLYGNVHFSGINYTGEPKVYFIDLYGHKHSVYTSGKLYDEYGGECTLFPSKDQRDWSKFKPKKPKFDPKTLQPFDKVIVFSDSLKKWSIDFYSYKDESKTTTYPYICCGIVTDIIIPYNEETKHLVGTTEEAPEFYKHWEE